MSWLAVGRCFGDGPHRRVIGSVVPSIARYRVPADAIIDELPTSAQAWAAVSAWLSARAPPDVIEVAQRQQALPPRRPRPPARKQREPSAQQLELL